MQMILIALLAGKTAVPAIDVDSLELQARAEALRPAAIAAAPRAPLRRASSSAALNLASITTICRAAGDQADQAAFLDRLSGAYSLSSGESASLRSSCAAYIAGQADARRMRD